MSRPPKVYDVKNAPQTKQLTKNNEPKIVGKSRECPVCHVYYKYGNSYWQHVRYVHARILSQCVICEKSYKRTTMVKHHILHSHKIAWHLCGNYVRKIKKSDLPENNNEKKNSTGKKSTDLKYFKKKTLHLISSFNCYDCPGSFQSITELFEHVKCHRKDSGLSESNFEFQNIDLDFIRDLDYELADSNYGRVESSSGCYSADHDKLDSSYGKIDLF